MRALVCHRFGDYHDLRVEEFPVPELPPGGVRIAVEYASLSFSISLWIAGKYQVKPPLPFVPGAEVVGRVIETAPGVTACRTGQRVFAFIGWGGYAEQAVSPQSTVYVLPDAVDSAAALHLGVSYCTAYGGLAWRAQLAAGEILLVLAAAGESGWPRWRSAARSARASLPPPAGPKNARSRASMAPKRPSTTAARTCGPRYGLRPRTAAPTWCSIPSGAGFPRRRCAASRRAGGWSRSASQAEPCRKSSRTS